VGMALRCRFSRTRLKQEMSLSHLRSFPKLDAVVGHRCLRHTGQLAYRHGPIPDITISLDIPNK
jgi:hypothetical protein